MDIAHMKHLDTIAASLGNRDIGGLGTEIRGGVGWQSVLSWAEGAAEGVTDVVAI